VHDNDLATDDNQYVVHVAVDARAKHEDIPADDVANDDGL
jgi:hypothetical protein